MKKNVSVFVYLLTMVLFIVLAGSCSKDDASDAHKTVKDVEGNKYKIVTIGTQTWMAENLRTTKLNDGSDIPLASNKGHWAVLGTPGYCWYNNDAAKYKAKYGAIYNYFTVQTAKLCPEGWHVSTDAEWSTLTKYLTGEFGDPNRPGDKLKEIGTTHWKSPNTGATNQTGFTALPGGSRDNNGEFTDIGEYGYWWTSTQTKTYSAWSYYMGFKHRDVFRWEHDKNVGYSVRCVKYN